MRLSAALFAAASLFGVLRFTGLYPQTFPHQFLTMLTSAAAFPALALAAARPTSRWVRETTPALGTVVVLGAVGYLVVRGLVGRPYVDACAVSSVIALFLVMRQRGDRFGGGAALAMFIGLMCFAAKFPASGPIAPGDLLHLGLATGWMLLVRSRR